MKQEEINDKQLEQNIDEWMRCWVEKRFPMGKVFTQPEWWYFRRWWLSNYPELPMKVGFRAWLFEKSRFNL